MTKLTGYRVFFIAVLLVVASAPWAGAQTATFSYDSSGRLQLADYGNGATVTYSYDSNGNLLSRIATEPRQHTVTVNKDGAGTGTVTSSPSGIDCGGACSQTFAEGGMVTLTATPALDSLFVFWSGDGCSGPGPCTVTVSADRTVTATFSEGGPLVFSDGFETGNTSKWSAAAGGR